MARKQYESTTAIPGLIPQLILPGDTPAFDIKTSPTGIGLTEEWMNNMPSYITNFYKFQIADERDPKYFLWNLYSFFTNNFNFVIEFEYLSRNSSKFEHRNIVRPNIYVNNEFIIGLYWKSCRWSALQQAMIEFLHHHIYKTDWFNRAGYIDKCKLVENTPIKSEDIFT